MTSPLFLLVGNLENNQDKKNVVVPSGLSCPTACDYINGYGLFLWEGSGCFTLRKTLPCYVLSKCIRSRYVYGLKLQISVLKT